MSGNTTEDLDAAVADARARYAAARPRALASHLAACEVMPGGNTRTVLHHAPFPLRVARADRAHIVDVDGHEYVDLLGEYTAGLFGHSHPVIRAAIDRALDRGLNLGAHHDDEARFARLVVERFPSIELVRFTNSGTEANLMALAAARVATGRDAVLVMDGAYHGGVLSFAHGPEPVNVPIPVHLARFNDEESVTSVVREHGERLAAILVEPMQGGAGCIPGEPRFLAALRRLADECGAMLVFDEVMTSRTGASGMQGRVGVTPDLTTLGKYLGGGMSFGAFGGRRDVMERFDPSRPDALGHAGTFNNNVLTMAAGIAAIGEVYTPVAAEALTARGDALRARLGAAFAASAPGWCCTGVGSIMTIHPVAGPVRSIDDLARVDDRRRELLFLELLDAGYSIARRGFVSLSLAVTDEELDAFVEAVIDVAAAVDRLSDAVVPGASPSDR